ncbi:MAG: LptF/LptG family permease [Geminicoccaceae bacterium]|nr:LptF/LptG family permease [Geminicoccaceae bacterium]
MSLFGRYIASLVLRPMIAIVLVALAVLLAERMLRVLDIVIGWRGSVLVLLEMLGYLIPHYMSIALPAAFFIAMLLVFSRLSRDGELDAMAAAGLGLHGLLRPLLAIAFVLLAVNAVVVSHLQPYGRYAYRAALFALSNVSFLALLREGSFVTLAGTTYTVASLSPERDRFTGLVLFTRTKDGDTLTVTARRGRILPAEGDQPIILDLEDGVHQFVPAATAAGAERSGARPPESTAVRFRTFRTDVRGGEPKPFRPRGEDERELTLPELWHGLARPIKGIDPEEIAAEFHGRLARILSLPLLPLLALPLAAARRRAKRSYGILVGLVLLIAYNQLLNFGESLADDGKASPWLAIWLPFALFATLGVLLTWWKATRVPRAGGAGRLDLLVERLESWAAQRFAAREPTP